MSSAATRCGFDSYRELIAETRCFGGNGRSVSSRFAGTLSGGNKRWGFAIPCDHSPTFRHDIHMRRHLIEVCFILCTASGVVSAHNCGETEYRQEIRSTERKILYAKPVEPTVGEYPTNEGTMACVRIEFRLTPSGKPWNVETPESSESFAFNLAAMRAFSGYRFQGSWWRFLERNVVIIKGFDNRKPSGWNSPGSSSRP